MTTVHFYSHNDALTSACTLQLLHRLIKPTERWVLIVATHASGEGFLDWLWQQEQWLPSDWLDQYVGGLAIAYPGGAAIPKAHILNASLLTLDTLDGLSYHELVHSQNKTLMRDHYRYYQKNGWQIEHELL